jgi:uncharacterized protein (TIGR03435 family)
MATLTVSRNGFIGRSITMLAFIGGAYRVEDHQISGAPDWLNSEKYDIEAKMDSSTAMNFANVPKVKPRLKGYACFSPSSRTASG